MLIMLYFVLILQLVTLGVLLYPKLKKISVESQEKKESPKWEFAITPKESLGQKLVKKWLSNLPENA